MKPEEQFRDILIEMEACDEAITWIGNKTLKEAWEQCERADWMMWLLIKMLDREELPKYKEMVLFLCNALKKDMARLHFIMDPSLAKNLEMAEKWCRNEIVFSKKDIKLMRSKIPEKDKASSLLLDMIEYARWNCSIECFIDDLNIQIAVEDIKSYFKIPDEI
jgi:hypothetical protein